MGPAILDRRVVYKGYLTVERLRLRLADQAVVTREVESHGDAIAVLPYDPVRRCGLIVRLFRAPVFSATAADSLEEACAGMIGDESEEAAVRREAREELGVVLTVLERVARIWSSPGVSTERQSLFLAPYVLADRTGRGGGVDGEHEGIAAVERPLEHLAGEADAGLVTDGKLFALVLALRSRRPDLFAGIRMSGVG
jgi:nudix-type nucleoside diphosphatase (YffH/AdpP family)